MIIPDENRKEIATGLALIALSPIDDVVVRMAIAKTVGSVAILIGGEDFMREVLDETKAAYSALMEKEEPVQ